MLWKLPALDETTTLKVRPEFPDGTVVLQPAQTSFAAGTAVQRWRIAVPGGLDGKPIGFTGLSTTGIDLLVRLVRSDGTVQLERILPASPTFVATAISRRVRSRADVHGARHRTHPDRLRSPAVRAVARPDRARHATADLDGDGLHAGAFHHAGIGDAGRDPRARPAGRSDHRVVDRVRCERNHPSATRHRRTGCAQAVADRILLRTAARPGVRRRARGSRLAAELHRRSRCSSSTSASRSGNCCSSAPCWRAGPWCGESPRNTLNARQAVVLLAYCIGGTASYWVIERIAAF